MPKALVRSSITRRRRYIKALPTHDRGNRKNALLDRLVRDYDERIELPKLDLLFLMKQKGLRESLHAETDHV
jgi:hypothetical protein